MRKKSHICLGRYLAENASARELRSHKKAFLLGSILPDIRPSFVTKKHEYNGTYEEVQESIRRLTTDCNLLLRNRRVYCRRMGEVIHYVADYFTFPHNSCYPGSLKDHCRYENDLKHYMRDYIYSGEAERNQNVYYQFYTVEELFAYIEACHEEYMEDVHSVEQDALYITRVCSQVVSGILPAAASEGGGRPPGGKRGCLLGCLASAEYLNMTREMYALSDFLIMVFVMVSEAVT